VVHLYFEIRFICGPSKYGTVRRPARSARRGLIADGTDCVQVRPSYGEMVIVRALLVTPRSLIFIS
jgi:hypothetical protein